MSDLLHCQHCEDEGGLKYKGWDHHCFMEGAGYIKWNDGECPLCAAALAERDEIVEYVSAKLGDDFTYAAMEIRDGEHLRWSND